MRLSAQFVATAALAALALAACSSEPEPTASTTTTSTPAPTEVTVELPYGGVGFGGIDTVPFDPQTIVVTDYAALDSLDALGLGDRVVGIPSATALPPHLASYADSAQNIGSLFEIDAEAVNALDPDLIIIGGRSYDQEESLEEIAPVLNVTFDWGSDAFVDSFVQNHTALGQVFGIEDQVASALADIEATAASVNEQATDAGTGLVILTSGGEVAAYGPGDEGRFDWVYDWAGITPAADQVAIETHGDAISFEFLAETNADLLFVLDRDAAIGTEGESAQAILDNDLVNGTSAALNGKVLYVDTAKWYLSWGGLNSVAAALDEIDSIVE